MLPGRLLLPGLLFCLQAPFLAGQVDSVQVFSDAMQRKIPCLVICPPDLDDFARLPVLYLLHGWSGNCFSMLKDMPQLPRLAIAHRMIIVCPDGGYDSWYLDSPVDSTVRYETFVARELTAWIDARYPTIPSAESRAITGVSMGGHGALLLAARHPGVYGAAGSMAGGLNLLPFEKNGWNLARVLGNYQQHRSNWQRYSVLSHAAAFRTNQQPLYLDVGNRDFFRNVNDAMHRELERLGVAHVYRVRPGEHNAAYWSEAVDDLVAFFNRFFYP